MSKTPEIPEDQRTYNPVEFNIERCTSEIPEERTGIAKILRNVRTACFIATLGIRFNLM